MWTSARISINVNFVTREMWRWPRRVFTKCSLKVIYTAEVTDCSLIEAEEKTHFREV